MGCPPKAARVRSRGRGAQEAGLEGKTWHVDIVPMVLGECTREGGAGSRKGEGHGDQPVGGD